MWWWARKGAPTPLTKKREVLLLQWSTAWNALCLQSPKALPFIPSSRSFFQSILRISPKRPWISFGNLQLSSMQNAFCYMSTPRLATSTPCSGRITSKQLKSFSTTGRCTSNFSVKRTSWTPFTGTSRKNVGRSVVQQRDESESLSTRLHQVVILHTDVRLLVFRE